MLWFARNLRSILAIPAFYRAFTVLIGTATMRSTFVNEYVRPQEGNRLLDIGCGPADILAYLPTGEYVGFDVSPDYIQAARDRYGHRGTFHCFSVSQAEFTEPASFDLAIAVGVLHHLNDAEALQLFQMARAALKPGGRLITLDNCYRDGQSRIARFLISKDRGQYVRASNDYRNLALSVFPEVKASIREDLLRIPYTQVILECRYWSPAKK